MTKSPPSHATPAMLAWARGKSGLAIDEVAELENTTVDRISEWERGTEVPTFSQLEKLAKRYKFPLMVFYLNEPPKDFRIVKDFRSSASGKKFTPQLTTAIRQAQERQAWASGYLEDEGFPEFPHLNSISENDDPVTTGASIRNLLAFPIHEQVSATRDSDSFANWKRHCERIGVFVFSAQSIDVDEMRGFALPDKYAPTVVLNPKDSYTARTFTLIHELVHIFAGTAAVTGAIDSELSPFSGQQIERFCNRVAAETIIPTDDFKSRVPKDWITRDDEVIRTLARRYWVSRAVIALRLVETGFASRDYYKKKISSLLSRPAEKESGYVPQHILALSRNGESFSKLTLSAFHAGDIHGGQLASLLNMRLQHLPTLETTLSPMRIQRALDESDG